MNGTIQTYNKLMRIIDSSKCWVKEKQCEEAKDLLEELDRCWTHARGLFSCAVSLGPNTITYHIVLNI